MSILKLNHCEKNKGWPRRRLNGATVTLYTNQLYRQIYSIY